MQSEPLKLLLTFLKKSDEMVTRSPTTLTECDRALHHCPVGP